MHYVIGDVHGCYTELMSLLDKIEIEDSNAKFIFVGDFVDRGPEIKKTLDWVIENISEDGKYTTVKGNHEEDIIDWYKNQYLPWLENGGDMLLLPRTRYDFSDYIENGELTRKDVDDYAKKFETFPLLRKLSIDCSDGVKRDFRICHAGYNPEFSEEKNQSLNIVLWERDMNDYNNNGEIIVHGHTPTIAIDSMSMGAKLVFPGMISYAKHRVNVDGGCVFNDKFGFYSFLCGFCLETFEEFYSSTLEQRIAEKYENEKDRDLEIDSYLKKMYTLTCKEIFLNKDIFIKEMLS